MELIISVVVLGRRQCQEARHEGGVHQERGAGANISDRELEHHRLPCRSRLGVWGGFCRLVTFGPRCIVGWELAQEVGTHLRQSVRNQIQLNCLGLPRFECDKAGAILISGNESGVQPGLAIRTGSQSEDRIGPWHDAGQREPTAIVGH